MVTCKRQAGWHDERQQRVVRHAFGGSDGGGCGGTEPAREGQLCEAANGAGQVITGVQFAKVGVAASVAASVAALSACISPATHVEGHTAELEPECAVGQQSVSQGQILLAKLLAH